MSLSLIFLSESCLHNWKHSMHEVKKCMSRVWMANLGCLPIIAWDSLTHIPCLFACFYESVLCVYAFFSTCLSSCVARAACFVFCSMFTTNFSFSFFRVFFYKFNRHLCHGAVAYWCTHSIAHMPVLLFLLHFHLSNLCACVCQLVQHFLPLSHSHTTITINICTNLKKSIRAHIASSKATRLFLTK